MRRFPLLIMASAVFAAPAAAAETIAVPKFNAIDLKGGGQVVFRHGPVQRVTILNGSTAYTRVEVPEPYTRRVGKNVTIRNSGETLEITACHAPCPRDYKLRVEVVSPEVSAVAAKGGGNIIADGSFPRQDVLGVAASGGATVDIRAMAAESVGASASGGGVIRTRPLSNLGASAAGGGQILYWGEPNVGVSAKGGGSVRRGG